SEATYGRLNAAGIKVSRSRLIDLTLAGARYEIMKAALDILTTAPEFDLVVVVVGSSARFYPELAVQPIIDSAGAGKPMAVFLVPEALQARAALGKAGVANFYTPPGPAAPLPPPPLCPRGDSASPKGARERVGVRAPPQKPRREKSPPPPPHLFPPRWEGEGTDVATSTRKQGELKAAVARSMRSKV